MADHGTRTRYVAGCGCTSCRTAHRVYENARRRRAVYGLPTTDLVDAAPVRAHVRALLAAGVGTRRIAALSGVERKTVITLLHGKRPGRAPTRRLRPDTAAALLAVKPDPADHTPLDATGTHRRLQALVVLGWSQTKLADRLGVTRTNFGALMRRARVTAATARAVAALYDELWDTAPPEHTWHDKAAATLARNHARTRGWVSPLAWDDDTIDDPKAAPVGAVVSR